MSDDRTEAEKLEGLTRAFKAATPDAVQKVGGLLAQAAGQFAEDAGQGAQEMTLVQWVESLPPMHAARRELRELTECVLHYSEQIARLPFTIPASRPVRPEHVVDAMLKRLGDTEGALAVLTDLAKNVCLVNPWFALSTDLKAGIDTAEKILAARPSALGGTARRAGK